MSRTIMAMALTVAFLPCLPSQAKDALTLGWLELFQRKAKALEK
jgi:hypothetical protein